MHAEKNLSPNFYFKQEQDLKPLPKSISIEDTNTHTHRVYDVHFQACNLIPTSC